MKLIVITQFNQLKDEIKQIKQGKFKKIIDY